MSLGRRLKQLEASRSKMKVAMLLPLQTGLNDGTRMFRWTVDGKAHGDIMSVDAHRDEDQGQSRLTGQAVWAETLHQLPEHTIALMFGAHKI